MKNNLVSIIVPVYNGEKYIKNCIDCLLNQTYDDIEIIVVNDGSTDHTLDIIMGYNHPKIKLISIPNGGVSNARNIGLTKAKGKYVLFVDSDDHIKLNTIEILVKLAIENGSDFIRFNGFIENDQHEFNQIEFDIPNITLSTNNTNEIIYVFNKINALRCYTPLLFMKNDRIKPFNTELKYLEDKLFYLENLTVPNKNILFYDIPLYYYRLNESSKTKSTKNIKANFKDIIDARICLIELVSKVSPNNVMLINNSINVLILHRLRYYVNRINKDEFIEICNYLKNELNIKYDKLTNFKYDLLGYLFNKKSFKLLRRILLLKK